MITQTNEQKDWFTAETKGFLRNTWVQTDLNFDIRYFINKLENQTVNTDDPDDDD